MHKNEKRNLNAWVKGILKLSGFCIYISYNNISFYVCFLRLRFFVFLRLRFDCFLRFFDYAT